MYSEIRITIEHNNDPNFVEVLPLHETAVAPSSRMLVPCHCLADLPRISALSRLARLFSQYKSYSVIDIQPSMGHTVITNRCARPVALTKVVAARARSTKLLGLGTTAVVAENEHCRVAPLN